MSLINKIWNSLRSTKLQNELDEELRLHLDLRSQELQRSGMEPKEADAAARRGFGNTTLETERMRRMDIAGWLETFFNDLRYAFRQFMRSPGFSAVALLSLALGIGANTAIFSVMNAVMLQDLPVHDPKQLVTLTNPNQPGMWTGIGQGERDTITYPEFLELRSRLSTVSGLFVAQSSLETWQIRVAGGQQEPALGRMVSENYFSVLGVAPVIGRVLSPQDEAGPGEDPYAVISFDYWQRRFGGKADVLGIPIKLNGAALTVIGVSPRGFKGETGGQNPDLWIPILMQPQVVPGLDWLHEDPTQSVSKIAWLRAFARLKPGVTLAEMQAEVNFVFKSMMEAFYSPTLPPEMRQQGLSQFLKLHAAGTGAFDGRDDLNIQLKILLAVAGLVLVIACANVANLLLARATARQREVGIRLSIGASRRRLLRQFLTESLLLSLLGGAAGLAVAAGSARLLVWLLSDPGQPLSLATGLDMRVLLFTIGITLVTGVLFGLAPSLRASRTNLNITTRESGQNAQPGGRISFAKMLVMGQVALSLLLVIAAGLFVRTLWRLQSVDLGYPRERLVQIGVNGATAGYKGSALASFYEEIAARLRTLPAIRGVTYSSLGLFTGGESSARVEVEGFTPRVEEDHHSRFDRVAPGYFGVIGIPLLLGRDLRLQDSASSAPVCVVNEAFAQRFLSGRNPVGLHLTRRFGKESSTLEIVGVVRNARTISLSEDIPQRFYMPVSQAFDGRFNEHVVFELRTVGEPKSIETAARKAILGLNPDVPVNFTDTMEEVVTEMTTSQRMIARLCAIFGGLALLLAATGLYGVLSYGVTRRTNEIGIRMALGAGRGSVVAMILRETGIMLAIGLALGIAAALASTRLIASQLYGLSQFDPISFVVSSVLLAAVALVAGYIPAARAARVDPVKALRHD